MDENGSLWWDLFDNKTTNDFNKVNENLGILRATVIGPTFYVHLFYIPLNATLLNNTFSHFFLNEIRN